MSKTYGWLCIERSLNIDKEKAKHDLGINAWFNMPGHERYPLSEMRKAYDDLRLLQKKYPDSLFQLSSYIKTILS